LGAPEKKPPKTPDDLVKDFVDSVQVVRTGVRRERWRRALATLECDPIFADADVASLSEDSIDWRQEASALYERLSSGHKIVLLTITRLVESVDERTLVLLDEPEAHLHPPLLSSFMRALSDLLIARNGVAIIATHSPVVLQEVPLECAWILSRHGAEVDADRPTIETFGENVGILTREVFGLEVVQSGFHALLKAAVAEGLSYEGILKRFGNRLGAEARGIARALIAARVTQELEDRDV
jgi:hypothetical protein